jgi:outer membrane protein, multidrug efflux system
VIFEPRRRRQPERSPGSTCNDDCMRSSRSLHRTTRRGTTSCALTSGLFVAVMWGCVPSPPLGPPRDPSRNIPGSYGGESDTRNAGLIVWSEFFEDPHLQTLLETSLSNNQELQIAVQEILVANAEVMGRRGEYLPKLGFGLGAGVEHVGKHTSQGRSDEATGVAATLPNYQFGLYASWELDVWGRLHDLADAAARRYLASIEGRNFMVTRLITEIASLYFELMALDRQLKVVTDNIALQENGLELVRLQFQAGRSTSLGPARFEAELRNMQSSQFAIRQRIVELENQLNFLAGRFPQPIERSSADFLALEPPALGKGVPSDLLANRPDVRRAELELLAAKFDVSAARAAFYPSVGIDSVIGYQSFDVTKLVNTPDSLLFGLFGRAFVPLLNRQGIKAEYFSANSREMQAVVNYERTVLIAFAEVSNRVSLIRNLSQGYVLKQQQVDQLVRSIEISTQLFNSGRADYLEVLTTRRESLEAQKELIEMKQKQMVGTVTLYQALGGGWRGTDPGRPDENAPNESNKEAPL